MFCDCVCKQESAAEGKVRFSKGAETREWEAMNTNEAVQNAKVAMWSSEMSQVALVKTGPEGLVWRRLGAAVVGLEGRKRRAVLLGVQASYCLEVLLIHLFG